MKIEKPKRIEHEHLEGHLTIIVSGESSDVCCKMERVCHVDTAALVEKKLVASVEKALIENGG